VPSVRLELTVRGFSPTPVSGTDFAGNNPRNAPGSVKFGPSVRITIGVLLTIKRAAAVGAATLFASLSLAGPQAMGVAGADAPDRESGSVAGPVKTEGAATHRQSAKPPRARSRYRISAPDSSSSDESPSQSADSRPTVRVVSEGLSAVGRALKSGKGFVAPAPGAVAPPVDRTEPITASAPTSAPAVLSPPAARAAAASPTAHLDVAPPRRLLRAIANVIDAVGLRLLGPTGSGPVTELISGGLWLVRRTLAPVGADVSRWGQAECVTTGDCSGADLTGAWLRYQDLSGVNFSGAKLLNANLAYTNSARANFGNADLTYAALFGADLTKANFANSFMYGTALDINPWWETAILSGVTSGGIRGTVKRVDLPADWTFANGYLVGPLANLKNADLSDAQLANATLFDAELNSANLAGADLTLADLTFADLSNAVLAGANLTSINRGRQQQQETVTNLSNADLTDANLTNANLVDATLVNANLTGANLTDATLRNADISGANLTGVTWRNTTCPDGSKTDSGCSAAG